MKTSKAAEQSVVFFLLFRGVLHYCIFIGPDMTLEGTPGMVSRLFCGRCHARNAKRKERKKGKKVERRRKEGKEKTRENGRKKRQEEREGVKSRDGKEDSAGRLFLGGTVPAENPVLQIVDPEACPGKNPGCCHASHSATAVDSCCLLLVQGSDPVLEIICLDIDVYRSGDMPLGKFFGGPHIKEYYGRGVGYRCGKLRILHRCYIIPGAAEKGHEEWKYSGVKNLFHNESNADAVKCGYCQMRMLSDAGCCQMSDAVRCGCC